VARKSQNLPQLYRFCFLMTGDEAKAATVFQDTVREAAFQSANGEPPNDRYWFFREARWRCLAASEQGITAEEIDFERHDLNPHAQDQINSLTTEQLGIWFSAAPEPQRTVIALFYLDEFSVREIMLITSLKMVDVARLLGTARMEFQSWLNATIPDYEE